MRQAYLKLDRRALLLQAAAEVSRATGSILDPDELIHQVVELTRERFGLYYVGLYLVDRTDGSGKWAVLRAGTGEAGRQMVAKGRRIQVDGDSMVGWCIANRQSRLEDNVTEEAARQKNPLLPDTRSKLALPLISRGQAIGAMTIQSAQPDGVHRRGYHHAPDDGGPTRQRDRERAPLRRAPTGRTSACETCQTIGRDNGFPGFRGRKRPADVLRQRGEGIALGALEQGGCGNHRPVARGADRQDRLRRLSARKKPISSRAKTGRR